MKLDKKAIDVLISDANKAKRRGEIPVSAIILDQSGKIVSHACNSRQKGYNVLGHAEIGAILKAEKKIHDWRLDGYKMIVVLEPCDMCSMIISKCRIDEVFYFISQKNGDQFNDFGIKKLLIDGYDNEKNLFENLLLNFFNNMR